MRPNHVKKIMKNGECAVSGWLSIPSSYSAELIASTGLDCVTVDLQHGMIGFDAAVTMLQAISTTSATPLVRVPENDGPAIMRALDAGAYGIICPMVSNAEEARSFVAACRYPPFGNRSFGPSRGLLYGGPDYFEHANETVLTLAMIETRTGFDNIDEILAVDGLDGIYLGPNDTCLAYGLPPSAEPSDPQISKVLLDACASAKSAGKFAGIFCSGADAAIKRRDQGFNLVTPGNDAGHLKLAASSAVSAIKNKTVGDAPQLAY
jgi:4-hydroxy-2-oxoheptanedioate aldolase